MGNRKKYTREELEQIWAKTHGFCHLCPKGPYTVEEYGKKWQVEHSTAIANDGRDDIRNWFVACVPCNQAKGTGSSSSFRRKMGVGGVPFSSGERKRHALLNFVRIPGLLLVCVLALAGLSATIDGPENVSSSKNLMMILGSVVLGLIISAFGVWYIFSVRGRETRPERNKTAK